MTDRQVTVTSLSLLVTFKELGVLCEEDEHVNVLWLQTTSLCRHNVPCCWKKPFRRAPTWQLRKAAFLRPLPRWGSDPNFYSTSPRGLHFVQVTMNVGSCWTPPMVFYDHQCHYHCSLPLLRCYPKIIQWLSPAEKERHHLGFLRFVKSQTLWGDFNCSII